MRRARLLAGIALAVAIWTGGPTAVQAAFPGENGRIVFTNGAIQVATMRPNGSGLRVLTHSPDSHLFATFSPNGRRIAFDGQASAHTDLFVMRADGSHKVDVTRRLDPSVSVEPSWSPTGRWIIFAHTTGSHRLELWAIRPNGRGAHRVLSTPNFDLEFPHFSPNGRWIVYSRLVSHTTFSAVYIARADGSDAHQLTPTHLDAATASWSPDGRWVVFPSNASHGISSLYRSRPNGAGLRRLTRPGAKAFNDTWPSWSPDGRMIAFNRDRCPAGPGSCTAAQIWVMRADGSHARQISSGSSGGELPDWGVAPR